MTAITKNSKSWIAGIFAAIAASLCCITPVLAFLGGASGLASSFSWIEPFRPYLIGATILFFAFAWYQKLKPQKQVECDCETDNKKSFWQSKLFLGVVTVVAAVMIAFPYYAKTFYPKPQQTKVIVMDKTNIQQAVFKIKGMTCEGCATQLNVALKRVKGVISAEASYANKNVKVVYNPKQVTVERIKKAIYDAGYVAK